MQSQLLALFAASPAFVLQCVAVCCSALQCVAVRCSVLLYYICIYIYTYIYIYIYIYN